MMERIRQGENMAKKLLSGNEAVAYGALAAGVKIVAGYPGTPSTEMIETLEASGMIVGK